MRGIYLIVLALPTCVLLSCSADDANSGGNPPIAGTGNGTSGSSTNGGSGSSTAGTSSSSATAGTTATGGDGGSSNGGSGSTAGGSGSGGSKQTPLALPFFVNAPGNFVKSGFMGDAMATVTAAPSETDPDGTCGGNRAGAMPGGDCDTFAVDPSKAGAEGWQGVFYQFPANNWGTFPGRTIATGAKSVKFQARASREVAVLFQIGMCDPLDATKCVDGFYAYPDSADDAGKISVGTEWKEFSVSLSGKDYSDGVHGAFSWSVSNDDLLGDMSELDLYVDAISWE